MAKEQGVNMLTRGAQGKGKSAPPARAPQPPAVTEPPAAPRRSFDAVRFFNEVKAEGRKITWTSWKETWITSVMVFIMVVVTSVFFLLTDGTMSFLIQQVLKLAG